MLQQFIACTNLEWAEKLVVGNACDVQHLDSQPLLLPHIIVPRERKISDRNAVWLQPICLECVSFFPRVIFTLDFLLFSRSSSVLWTVLDSTINLFSNHVQCAPFGGWYILTSYSWKSKLIFNINEIITRNESIKNSTGATSWIWKIRLNLWSKDLIRRFQFSKSWSIIYNNKNIAQGERRNIYFFQFNGI